jgi:dTDP-4-amino-4,6-dideoxygalactose transaminase
MKEHVDQLAILGGRPAFAEALRVGRPNIGDRTRLLERINTILDTRDLTNDGPYVQEFERQVAAITGVRHCVAVCNGTTALQIAARALGLSGEVIVPAQTYVATAHALQWQEITPVFCDIDPQSLCIDPAQVEGLITQRTTGIIGVHLFGRPCDVAALQEIAVRRGLKLLLDAAHALGCSWQGRMIGGLGDAEVFSFHATKFINSFEGGAIATNDDDLAMRARLMRKFGLAAIDRTLFVGTNGKLTEVAAAMGLTSLESMAQIIAANRQNYGAYLEGLRDVPGVAVLRFDERERCNFQFVVLLVDPGAAGVTRDCLMRILRAENVHARHYYYPGCHRLEPYRAAFAQAGRPLPVTDRILDQVLCMPTGTVVSVEDVQQVCQVIRLVVANAGEVNNRIGSKGGPPC